MILIGSGLWSHLDQKEIALASSNLALVTGHMGKASCASSSLKKNAMHQGAVDMELFSEGEVPKERSPAKGSRRKNKGTLSHRRKSLCLFSCSGKTSLRKKFHWSSSKTFSWLKPQRRLKVVLPACSFLEKGGTYTNLERRVQKIESPPFHLFTIQIGFWYFSFSASPFESPIPGDTPEAVFEEIGRVLPHYRGIQDGEQWPSGSPFLYADGFPMGKSKTDTYQWRSDHQNPEGFSFCLIQRPSLFQSGSLSSKSNALKQVSEKPFLEMNPEDGQLSQDRRGRSSTGIYS